MAGSSARNAPLLTGSHDVWQLGPKDVAQAGLGSTTCKFVEVLDSVDVTDVTVLDDPIGLAQ